MIPLQFVVCAGWIVLANVVASWAFPLLFGQQWEEAVPYLRAMSAGYLAVAVLHPVSTSPQIMELQMLSVTWQVARLFLVVTGVIVAWHEGLPAVQALWLASAAQVAACMAMLALIARSIQRIQHE